MTTDASGYGTTAGGDMRNMMLVMGAGVKGGRYCSRACPTARLAS